MTYNKCCTKAHHCILDDRLILDVLPKARMRHLIVSARQAVEQKNWFAALSLSLIIPDICGRISFPKENSSEKRYTAWFNKYLLHKYKGGFDQMQFLHGADCYALRCAMLHQGEFSLIGQRARKVLERILFTSNNPGMHNNLANDVLQLDVGNFCEEVCKSVEEWLSDEQNNPAVQSKISELAIIDNVLRF